MYLIIVDYLLCCAALYDIKSGKIPNQIPLAVLILGGIKRIEDGGFEDIIQRPLILIVLFSVLVISHHLKLLGGGDVKLLLVYTITIGVRRGISVCVLSCLYCAIYALLLFLIEGSLLRRLEIFLLYVRMYAKEKRVLEYPMDFTRVAFGVFIFGAAISNDLYLMFRGG